MFKDDYFEHLPQEGKSQILPPNPTFNDEYEGIDE